MVRTCLVRELVEELRARDAALPHVVVVDLDGQLRSVARQDAASAREYFVPKGATNRSCCC